MKPTQVSIGTLAAVLASFLGLTAQSTSPTPPNTAPSDILTLAPGERLVLQIENSLHTQSSRAGDRAYFKTIDEVFSGTQVAIPTGSTVYATVTKVKRPGRIKGRAEIRLRFDEINLPDGTTLPLSASVVRAGFTRVGKTKEGDPRLKGEGGSGGGMIAVAQGGAQGAILGAALGGRKGAAYGGAAGAGIGLLNVILQRGPDLDIPRDMLFEVQLDQALSVSAPIARRAAQMAANRRQASSPSRTSPSADSWPPKDEAEPIPDFSQDKTAETEPAETTTVAINREPVPVPTTPETPSPVWDEPALEDPDGFKLKVDVQLVMLDAVIRDRQERPMEHLRREDFRVFEDGVEQQVRHFSRDELPLAVALVVDRSGSVAPFMRELRRAAYQALSQLKRGDQVALFAFASDVQRLEDLTTDRQRIAERISRIRAGGGTNIIDGIFDAVYYLGAVAPDRRRAVILISDNHATTRPRASQDQAIRMALETETVVYSIKTSGEPTPVTMRLPNWLSGTGSVRKVTRETGGEIINVTQVGSLEAALAAVVSRLKLRYTLGYHSTNTSTDGGFRKIDVQLTDHFGRSGQDYSVHARRGYYASGEATAKSTP